jgi:hypothetical protein
MGSRLLRHDEVTNKRGTVISVGQHWRDNNPTRDPIRYFEITGIEDEHGYLLAVCQITHGITSSGERVEIDREVRIDVDRLHAVRAGYQQVTAEGQPV